MKNDPKLCYRCERRALFLENGSGPRFECKDVQHSVNSCYMFNPVKPISVKRLNTDPRPISLNMLGCRVNAGETDGRFKLYYGYISDNEVFPYWKKESRLDKFIRFVLTKIEEKRMNRLIRGIRKNTKK